MKSRDGPYALDLVNVTAGLREPLSEKRHARAISKQQQPLGLGQANMLTRELSACRSLLVGHSLARRMEAGQRRAISFVVAKPDRGKHALGQRPRLAADRLPHGRVLQCWRIAE